MIEGLVLVEDDDGHRAASRALASFGAQLAFDGTRPIADRAGIAVSITHTRGRAIAAAGPFAALGIDLVDDRDAQKVERIAPRFLDPSLDAVACFAAMEAGLKALGLGLLDGGVFDDCAVRVLSLDPPRLVPDSLQLVVRRVGTATLAVVYLPLP